MGRVQIGVIGSGEADSKLYQLAEEVGREIARAGAVLICGGLGGVMEACAKGAKKQGGITVGILPGMDRDEANEFIDIKIVTAMSHARNAIIARSADALIAVGGEFGTLSEIALGLKMGRPVVILEGTFPEMPIISEKVLTAKTPREAVTLALNSTRTA
jgi:hypothetical protein